MLVDNSSNAEDALGSEQYATGIIARTLSSLRGSVDFCSIRKCAKSQIWCRGLDTSIPKILESVCGNSIWIFVLFEKLIILMGTLSLNLGKLNNYRVLNKTV